jgi:hypothetical protein
VSRYPYSGEALVSMENEQFTCRAVEIGVNGLVLIPPVRSGIGRFARMNLSLPGLDEVIDVDGIVVRETKADGYYALEMRFHEPSKRASALLAVFVRWVEKKVRAGNAIRRLTTSGGIASVRRRGTGPNLETVRPKSTSYPDLDVDTDVGRYNYNRPKEKSESGPSAPVGRESDELRRLYREALEDIVKDSPKKKK